MLPFYGQRATAGRQLPSQGTHFQSSTPMSKREPHEWVVAKECGGGIHCFLGPHQNLLPGSLLAFFPFCWLHICTGNTAESLPAWENPAPLPGSQLAITWTRNKPLLHEVLSLGSVCSSSNISVFPFLEQMSTTPCVWRKEQQTLANYLKAMGRWRFNKHVAVKRTGWLGIEMSLRKPCYFKQNWTRGEAISPPEITGICLCAPQPHPAPTGESTNSVQGST